MLAFAKDDLGLDPRRPPVTLGSLAVKYLEKRWELEGIDPGAVNGFDLVEQRRFNRNTGKGYLTKKGPEPRARYSIYEKLAERCFHGGRNECFWYGPTSEMSSALYSPWEQDWDGERLIGEISFREFDLAAAYATALASLGLGSTRIEFLKPVHSPEGGQTLRRAGDKELCVHERDLERSRMLRGHGAGLVAPLHGDVGLLHPIELALDLSEIRHRGKVGAGPMRRSDNTVSYTHLTLPTTERV